MVGGSLTVPEDFPAIEVYVFLADHGFTPANPCPVQEIVEATGADERRLREWLEEQEDYPIASTGRGFWACKCKRDWFPAIRYTVRVFLAYKRRWKRQVRMMMLHHPRHDQLFDDEQYRRAA
jgi:hypothetical protein